MSGLKQVDNASYKTTIPINASRLKQVVWYCWNWLFFKNSFNISSTFKISLLRLFGAKIGKGVVIKPCVNIKYPWKLQVGDHSWIGEEVWIDNLEEIIIGNSVCLSQGALLLSGSHNYKRPSFDLMLGKIILEDGVWIGARSIVLGGVVCKSHSVLGVNSVAKNDLEPYTIYSGNPAVAVKQRVIE